jgi:hypothetical protein
MIIRGLKSSGARWHDHMAQTLRDLAYKTCVADHDVWMKPKVKPTGEEYWEYVLIYSDDILVISHDPKAVIDILTKAYPQRRECCIANHISGCRCSSTYI